MENNNADKEGIPASANKIQEYIERVKKGESIDSFQLPPKMREAVEQGLNKETTGSAPERALIPKQYEGLDSETLDFIWTIPEYLDPEKTRQEQERKNQALEHVRNQELLSKQKEERQSQDQQKIDDLRKELGAPEDNLQKKVSEYDDSEHQRAIGIYNTMVDIAAGAREGLKEDIEKKIQKYVDEIRSGKNVDYVLQGLPDKWKHAVKSRLEENTSTDYENMSPEDVLRKLAEYSEPYMSAPVEAVRDGSFAGIAKLKIEDGNVILVRHASDADHLIKRGKEATGKEMMDSSLFLGGAHEAGAVHTSADVENWIHRYGQYPLYGEFKIPVKEFLSLGRESKIIIGNLSEAEIVISGDVAKKYLHRIVEKK